MRLVLNLVVRHVMINSLCLQQSINKVFWERERLEWQYVVVIYVVAVGTGRTPQSSRPWSHPFSRWGHRGSKTIGLAHDVLVTQGWSWEQKPGLSAPASSPDLTAALGISYGVTYCDRALQVDSLQKWVSCSHRRYPLLFSLRAWNPKTLVHYASSPCPSPQALSISYVRFGQRPKPSQFPTGTTQHHG